MARPLQQLGTLSALGKTTLAAAVFAATGLGAAAGVLTMAPQPAVANSQAQPGPADDEAQGGGQALKDIKVGKTTVELYSVTPNTVGIVGRAAPTRRLPEAKDRDEAEARRSERRTTAPRGRATDAGLGAPVVDDSTGTDDDNAAEVPPSADEPDAMPDDDDDATNAPPPDDPGVEEPADDDTSSEDEPSEGEGDGQAHDGGGSGEESSNTDAPPAAAEG